MSNVAARNVNRELIHTVTNGNRYFARVVSINICEIFEPVIVLHRRIRPNTEVDFERSRKAVDKGEFAARRRGELNAVFILIREQYCARTVLQIRAVYGALGKSQPLAEQVG